MLTSESTLAEIVAGRFAIDLFNVRLTQQTDDPPQMFLGHGRLSQDADGGLLLRLYVELTPGQREDRVSEMNNPDLVAGQIVDRRRYFGLEGRDAGGTTWVASDLWLTWDEWCLGNSVCAVKAVVRSIEQRIAFPGSATGINTASWIPGKYQFPFDMPYDGRAGFNHLEISLEDDGQCTVSQLPDFLVVTVRSPSPAASAISFTECVLEGLGVAAGAHLVAQVESRREDGYLIETLSARNDASNHGRRLPSPLPSRLADREAWAEFLRSFLNRWDAPYAALSAYWFRILCASNDSGPENLALVLTTSIEGVIREYFAEEMAPDEDFQTQIEQAKVLLGPVALGERARGSVLSGLGLAQKGSPANALRALVDSGQIPKDLQRAWGDLRPKAAHALGMHANANLQPLVNLNFACLELFYRLLMLTINYRGRIRRFGSYDWPNEPASGFASSRSIPTTRT